MRRLSVLFHPPLLWCALAAASGRAEVPPAPPVQTVGPIAPGDLPAVDDPALAPAGRPAVTLGSWAEARDLLDRRSTDLGSAVAAVARAEGRARQALGGLLPSARAQVGVGHDFVNPDVPALGIVGAGGAVIAVAQGKAGTPTSPVVGMALNASAPVVDLAAWMNLGAARDGVDSATFSEADVRRRMVQALSRSLVAVVAAERAAELNRLGLQQALERAALTVRLEQLGSANTLDVVRVSQDVEVARASLIAGDEQLFRVRESLGQLLGADGEVGVAPGLADIVGAGLLDDLQQECRQAPAAERDDVQAADAARRQANASVDQARFGYAPRLDLATSAAALTTTPGPVALGTWSIGAVVSMPLWEGGVREGLVDERVAAVRAADEAATATRRAADVEVVRASRYEGTARALFDAAIRSRDLALRADELTRRSFALGRVSSLDVVQTATLLRQAELVLAAREFDLAQARLDAFLTAARCTR